jgi:hypothetical protein
LGQGILALWLVGAGACGGVVESDSGASAAGSAGTSPQYACPACSNAKLSCVVNGSTDSLQRTATSKLGCVFDFGSSSFSIDCGSQTFCIEGIGCSMYSASGSGFSVNSSFGRVSCSASK